MDVGLGVRVVEGGDTVGGFKQRPMRPADGVAAFL
jgi:hypothetical protein